MQNIFSPTEFDFPENFSSNLSWNTDFGNFTYLVVAIRLLLLLAFPASESMANK